MEIKKIDGFYKLVGSLDEKSDLSALFNLNENPIRIDLEFLRNVNSLGLQKLTAAIETWGDIPFEYHHCTFKFANQIDMLKDLLGRNGKVVSLILPFGCEVCDRVKEIVVKTSDLQKFQGANISIKSNCPNCGGDTEHTPMEDFDFVFL